jgi:RNA 2',3'-cyclic 3'-phosphodiesterase
VRLFTAVDISEEVRERLKKLLDQLRPLADMRWSPVGNLHITTKFIGELPEARLGELAAAIGAIPATGPISIAIRNIGWFPNPHRPRVLWAGVEASENLAALARAAEQKAAGMGFKAEEREFHPHLTLARTREGTSKETLNSVRRAIASLDSTEFGTFQVTKHVLYLSAGGRYTKLREFSLLKT